MTERITIFQGYACNNNCRFCCNGDKRNEVSGMNTSQVMRAMKKGRENGAHFIDFIGGEPTIRKNLVPLVRYAKDLGFTTIATTTNGRMYSYKEYAKKMVDAGLNSLIFSIHGPNPKVHDYLTRVPGSFDQAIEGIKNIQELGVRNIEINTTIVKPNYKHLPEMAKLFLKLKVWNPNYIFPDPTPVGYAYKYFQEMVPTYTDAMPYVKKAIQIAIDSGKKGQILTQYVPVCFMKGYEKHVGEFFFEPETEHHASDFVNENVVEGRKQIGKLKGKQCRKCRFDPVCEGVWKQYGKIVGLHELVPVIGKKLRSKKELALEFYGTEDIYNQ
ncbi:MAG: 7,8-dihydro-6-hydroxymethylpterin dimethyltransferase [Candidatus Woesearchaeota archaeon]|nr:7,8-dihydro-6-hydroxymethylpterin dimethyltransferase [Candidatus Woesearchaeota archaeon]